MAWFSVMTSWVTRAVRVSPRRAASSSAKLIRTRPSPWPWASLTLPPPLLDGKGRGKIGRSGS